MTCFYFILFYGYRKFWIVLILNIAIAEYYINMNSTAKPVYNITRYWYDDIRFASTRPWISCKFKGQNSIRGEFYKTAASVRDNTLVVSDNFAANLVDAGVIFVRLKRLEEGCFLIAPKLERFFMNGLIIFQAAASMCLCVSADYSDEIYICDKETLDGLHVLKMRAGDVFKCKWFPSGQVVLTAGSNMRVELWCAITGARVRSLIDAGHFRPVTDVCIVDRGRNIISVSKDGCCKLWNVAFGRCIDELLIVDGELTFCCISTFKLPGTEAEPLQPAVYTRDQLECGTDDKIVLIGSANYQVYCVKVCDRSLLFTVSFNATPAYCCLVVPGTFIVGCSDGSLHMIKVDDNQEPTQFHWHETESPVYSLLPYLGVGFFSAHADGSCIFHPLDTSSKFQLQLIGPQFDPIYDMCYDGKFIYTASRDGYVRTYDVEKYVKKGLGIADNVSAENGVPSE